MGKETGIDLRVKALLIALLSVAVGFGLASCKGAKGKKALVIPVVLQEAVSVDLAVEVRLAGEVQADVEVRVISLVPERITKLTFEEGDTVKKGELLAVIRPGALNSFPCGKVNFQWFFGKSRAERPRTRIWMLSYRTPS